MRDAVAARRRRARDGRRRRLAGDRRGDRRRARPAVRLHPGGHAQPLRARPRRRPRRRRRRPRRVRRRRRAPRRPGRGQRPRVRQQRLARALRRGGPARGLSRREAAHAARHACRTCSGPRASGARPALDRPGRPRAPLGRPRSSSPTTATGSAARSARARGRGSTTACSGSRSSATPGGARRGGGCLQRPWREWSAPDFEVDADGPIAGRHRRRGADARARRCGSASGPASCACGSRAQHPGASPSAGDARGRCGRRSDAGADRRRPAPRCGVAAAPPQAVNRSDQPTEGDRMDIIEIEQKETPQPRGGRGPAAHARRHARPQQRRRVRARRDAVQGPRPRRGADFKVELEVETDERELEIELKW